MLRIWGRRCAFNVQKVLWLVGELALQHESIQVGGRFGRLDSLEFGRLNPHRRIPVIEDDKVVVWESHAILRYLAARYGEGRFWGDDPGQRAQMDGWMDWAQTTLQPDFLDGVYRGFFLTPGPRRDREMVRAKLAQTNHHFELLDRMLAARDYLGGDEPGLADFPLGVAVYRYLELDIERPRLFNLLRWYHRLRDRPAYRAAVMLPFVGQRGRLH